MEFLASVHPKVVHFPIAFLMLYPIMELLFLFTTKDFFLKAALLFLSIGVIGSLLAVLSGNQAYQSIINWSNEGKEIFYAHQNYANLTVWYFAALLIIRYFLFIKKRLIRKLNIIIIVLALIGGYFVYQAGAYGGKLADQVTSSKVLNKELQK